MSFVPWCVWMARDIIAPGLRELAAGARAGTIAHPGRALVAGVALLALWKLADLALWALKRLWIAVAVGLGIGAAILVAGRL